MITRCVAVLGLRREAEGSVSIFDIGQSFEHRIPALCETSEGCNTIRLSFEQDYQYLYGKPVDIEWLCH